MQGKRTVKRTRFPSIYRVSTFGKSDRFMVSYRIRGVGQRTRTFRTLKEAKEFQATTRDPVRAEQLRQLVLGVIGKAARTVVHARDVAGAPSAVSGRGTGLIAPSGKKGKTVLTFQRP